MTVLGLDTTGSPVSAAISRDGKIAGCLYADVGKKHSATLMPVIDKLLEITETPLDSVEAIAVSSGPGSFTGIRIGAACAEGLAYGLDKPLYTVNSLDALIENMPDAGVRCSLMDARRSEVYVKAMCGGEVIIDSQAMPLSDVLELLKDFNSVVFNGDGAAAYSDIINGTFKDCVFAGGTSALQNAASVLECVRKGMYDIAENGIVKPCYLRLSQAERLKNERKSGKRD